MSNEFRKPNNYQQSRIVKIESFWKDKDNNIPIEDLFSTKARNVAEQLSKTGIKFNQLRNFYDDFLSLQMRLKLNKDFNVILPYVNKILSKLNYSVARGIIKSDVENFFKDCINNIRNEKDFIIFIDFFESIIAFSKSLLK